MYKIIGGDRKEYGPVSADQIRQWIAEGRASSQTQAQAEGGSEWKPLSAFPEFADALTARAKAFPPAQGATASSQVKTGEPAPIAEGDYQLDLGGCIVQGWALVKARPGVLLLGAFVYLTIVGALSGAGSIPLVGPLFSLASFVVTGPLMAGLWFLFIRVIRGEAAEVGDVFAGFRKSFGQLVLGYIVPTLLAVVCLIPALVVASFSVLPALLHQHQQDTLQLIILIAATFLCLLPAIFLQTCWIFTLPLIIDRQMGFWPAMKTSLQRVKMHWWQVFGLVVLIGLVNLGGLLLCCVGIFVAVPIGLAALMYAYETIFSGKGTQAG